MLEAYPVGDTTSKPEVTIARVPKRYEIADALIGSGSINDDIRNSLESRGIWVPEGFMVTPFDSQVLNQVYMQGKRIASPQIARYIEGMFVRFGFPSVGVSEDVIDNYFDALRGKLSGLTKAESVQRVTDAKKNGAGITTHVFPDIRQRFNLAYILKSDSNVHGIPPYKINVEFAVATMFAKGFNYNGIKAKLKTDYVGSITRVMRWELATKFPEKLNNCLHAAVDEYCHQYSRHSLEPEYRAAIERGKYLTGAKFPLSNFVAESTAQLWLEEFAKDHAVFNPLEFGFVLNAMQEYILGGASRANYWAIDPERKLGNKDNHLGAFIVELVCGLPSRKSDITPAIDAADDYLHEEYQGRIQQNLLSIQNRVH